MLSASFESSEVDKMNWSNALLLAFSIFNSLGILIVFYYVNRNWEKLIELTNHLNNIDRNAWSNTEKLAEMNRKLNK
jgi:hypothetical protein